ncbi:hypothetical protein ACH4OY_11375 [Micromonospora rubida]|uniref:Uncharacterized protein n=1 Tax=Micromonospora rubida TaxID=2697657 RepID=A0ABW7SKQ5_9ACTN
MTSPGSDRRSPVAAWTVLIITGGLTAGSVVAWWVAAPPWHPWLFHSVVDLVVGAGYGVVAWLALLRRAHLAAWIMAAAGVGGSVSAAATGWAMIVHRWPDLWGPPQLLGAADWTRVPGSYALIVVLPWLLPVRPSAGPPGSPSASEPPSSRWPRPAC